MLIILVLDDDIDDMGVDFKSKSAICGNMALCG